MKCLRCGKRMRLQEAPLGWVDHCCQFCGCKISHKESATPFSNLTRSDTLVLIEDTLSSPRWEALPQGWLAAGEKEAS